MLNSLLVVQVATDGVGEVEGGDSAVHRVVVLQAADRGTVDERRVRLDEVNAPPYDIASHLASLLASHTLRRVNRFGLT